MRCFAAYESPLGDMLVIAGKDGLEGVHFHGQKHFPRTDESWREDPDAPLIRRTIELLDRYFGGERIRFDVPLAPRGTECQLAVWKAISGVPYGETISYGELARRAGIPNAPRAAGAATGRNPIGIVVPCHRIVGANGSLTGYAGGLDKKRALLALEAGFAQPILVSQ
ncbi:MAG: methylated-DNA--[protein]-cysteine S-methyltransferase [Gammaproteobacteria bacterium]|nr:methylated-DNA--[protein]-cysteine S-methyltransferase [Gammaproteobacteria bacterium]